ncbi:glycosyltransferase family 31 protein [Mixia osmundae IAM 14324]|uniref:Glycosyltransferase family 31 protein n=1 Tax=Mixia osmundae (strain CBS 9802 / IAM 14324 / JCM 22182 / KY 12970) TaxID=764103 RepID=G7E3V9_MIXOS|nr:glycosyltransferase family 31 protein [Mixia osmundae IAM 14324]KEI41964.1 glycosyltransferase family 31 protein [Mixia osmundae IAM 14324]GAA97519.1 hypothetical protein E5Q_04197 [Mixia osmundae IAM 14324]
MRTKLLSVLLVLSTSLLLFTSWRSTHPSHRIVQLLEYGRHTTISITTDEHTWTFPGTSINDSVPWTSEPLYGSHSVGFGGVLSSQWAALGNSGNPAKAGKAKPGNLSRTLDTYPRQIELAWEAPTVQQLLFSVATKADRAFEFMRLWPHWLQHGSPCQVVLPEEDRMHADSLRANMTQLGLERCILHFSTQDSYDMRVLSQVSIAMDYVRQGSFGTDVTPRWIIVGDDDTFWLDIRSVQRLASQYDSNEMIFMGGVTEAMAQYGAFGIQAYGGAGIIFSVSLAREMSTRMPDCEREFATSFGGDGKLTRCAALAMNRTKEDAMTVVDGLHQLDVPGDNTGMFQSGLPFISIHHFIAAWVDIFPTWISGGDFFVSIDLLRDSVAFLGGDNLFKRFVFNDGRTLLTLGYSITFYSQPLLESDLHSLEYTWAYDGYKLRYPDRPLIPEAPPNWNIKFKERRRQYKRTFFLRRVERLAEDSANFLFEDNSGGQISYIWHT